MGCLDGLTRKGECGSRLPPTALTLALVPSCGEVLLTLFQKRWQESSSYQCCLQLFLMRTADVKAAAYSGCDMGVLQGRPAPTKLLLWSLVSGR